MHIPLARHQHLLLFAVMLVLFFAVWERPESLLGRFLWLADVGLFLLWQPVVNPERRLRPMQVILVVGLVGFFAVKLAWAGLAVWAAFLSALVGGKVILARSRRLAWFYLLAFAFTSFLLFAWISPQVVIDPSSFAREGLEPWVPWAAALTLLALLLLMPMRIDEGTTGGVYDFFISLSILLVISVILMRAHMLVVVDHLSHLDAVVQSLLSFGLLLLLLSWAWNPRLGFSGIGALASRYLLRLGFPFDEWLGKLTELSDSDAEPVSFLGRALASLQELSWVAGGRWRVGSKGGQFGEETGKPLDLTSGDVELVLFASYRWTAALVWQVNLLLRLIMEFYRAKQRDRLLQKMQYLQAVHETGSRVTHDVKNLLQSLDSLCFALDKGSPEREAELAGLMRRQLPVITQRLRTTLGKLSHVADEEGRKCDLSEWWSALLQRYQGQEIGFTAAGAMAGVRVPQEAFDGVVENLLGNALQKRLAAPTLRISVELAVQGDRVALRVSDDGEPFAPEVAALLFIGPVPSDNGLGIGLYHAAALARQEGYALRLIENRARGVTLELARES